MNMKTLIAVSAIMAAFPLLASAQNTAEPRDVPVKQEIAFDANGDGVEDKILILAEGCEDQECPVVLMMPEGSVTLGYGSSVETGFVSPAEMGVNNPEDYPAQVPIVKIDGVMMAYDGTTAYPVADLISNGYFEPTAVTPDDISWLSDKMNGSVAPEQVMKVVGDLSPNGKDVVYSISSSEGANTSAWFIRSAAGNEILRGFSMDYPRIYQNGDHDFKVLSVSLSGIGVVDLSFGAQANGG